MRRFLLGLTFSLAVALAWISTRTHAVAGDDMAPSVMDGDLVVSIPTSAILPGDVVLIQDPLDPSRTILRRVMAVAGQEITNAKGHIKVGKRRLRAAAAARSLRLPTLMCPLAFVISCPATAMTRRRMVRDGSSGS